MQSFIKDSGAILNMSKRCLFLLLSECISQDAAHVALDVVPDHEVGTDPCHADGGCDVRGGLGLRKNARSYGAADQLKN